MSIIEQIHHSYRRNLVEGSKYPEIHPFIGKVFRKPSSNMLRVMSIGINAYRDRETEAVEPIEPEAYEK